MLAKGEAVLIERAKNGFIINPKDGLLAVVDEDVHVFSDFGKMCEWLGEHFEPAEAKKMQAVRAVK